MSCIHEYHHPNMVFLETPPPTDPMHPHGALGQGGGSGDDQAGSCVGEYGARVMGVGVGVGTTPLAPISRHQIGESRKGWVGRGVNSDSAFCRPYNEALLWWVQHTHTHQCIIGLLRRKFWT